MHTPFIGDENTSTRPVKEGILYATQERFNVPVCRSLSRIPPPVQIAFDIVLPEYKWNSCLDYLNYIHIFSNNLEDQIEHLG